MTRLITVRKGRSINTVNRNNLISESWRTGLSHFSVPSESHDKIKMTNFIISHHGYQQAFSAFNTDLKVEFNFLSFWS